MKDTHKKNQNTNKHLPVLLPDVLTYVDPKEGESYLDLTAGYGGHAEAILGRTLRFNHAYLVDRDQNAIDYLQTKFENQQVQIIHDDFLSAAKKLYDKGRKFDIILADLGVSSPHLDDANRGFSFMIDGPLDMRMDNRQSLTAADLVNTGSEAELADIFFAYGEEKRSRRYAKEIVKARPFTSTTQLADFVRKISPGFHKTHPATKIFQALRIAVNNELGMLKEALPVWIDLLNPGGRIAIISFHSLEDRLVKEAFQTRAGNRYDAILQLITKRPVVADRHEVVFNPRSRSAKLRVAAKINTKKGE